MSEAWKIGIDLGKRTGFAAIHKKSFISLAQELVGDFGERYLQLEIMLSELIEPLQTEPIEMAVYEEPPYVRNMKTYGELCGYEAIVIYVLESFKIPWYGINNRTLKKEMCGSGNADKKMMLAKACELAGREIKSQDEGDAILCAFYAEKLLNNKE